MKKLNFLRASSLLIVTLVMATFLFTSTNTTDKSNEQIITTLSEKIATMDVALKEMEAANEMVGVEPFLGEITVFGGTFAPRGWAFCNGQLLPISENNALFSLLGTTYGGDGRSTFALPDLRGRVPVHVGGRSGQGPGLLEVQLGKKGGSESIEINKMEVSKDGGNNTEVISRIVGDNRQPYLGVNYIIALQGVFPSRS